MPASAQTTPPSNTDGTGLLVLPRPGAPLSLDKIEERSKKLPDGTSSIEVTMSRVHRDSAGRVRIELLIRRDPDHPAGATSFPAVDIIDPIAGSRVIVLSHLGVAHRTQCARPGESGLRSLEIGSEASMASSHRLTARAEEDCGKRTIAGIEFNGTRTIHTAEDQPHLTVTIEQWYSEELKLIGAVMASGPDETYVAGIQNVRREEPDPSLFRIPPDVRSIVDHSLPDEP